MEMKLFRREEESIPLREVPSRVQKMTREDLILWADNLLMQSGATFDAWRFRDMPIQEVAMTVETLAAILVELQAREKYKSNT